MALGYLPFGVPAVYLFDGERQFFQVRGCGNGNVVRWQEQLNLRIERGQSLHRLCVSREVGLWNKEVNGSGIERVAGEQESVLSIEQRKGIGCMAGREDHFKLTSAEIEVFTIMQKMTARPGTDLVRALGYTRREFSA